jgi:hypothetical protein
MIYLHVLSFGCANFIPLCGTVHLGNTALLSGPSAAIKSIRESGGCQCNLSPLTTVAWARTQINSCGICHKSKSYGSYFSPSPSTLLYFTPPSLHTRISFTLPSTLCTLAVLSGVRLRRFSVVTCSCAN